MRSRLPGVRILRLHIHVAVGAGDLSCPAAYFAIPTFRTDYFFRAAAAFRTGLSRSPERLRDAAAFAICALHFHAMRTIAPAAFSANAASHFPGVAAFRAFRVLQLWGMLHDPGDLDLGNTDLVDQ